MIILDETYVKIQDPNIRGRKPKYRVEKDQDGIRRRYIYKYGAINYEIYAELIAEQLGNQMGIEMAHYALATDGKTIGLLTDNFLVPGEFLCSSDYIKENIEKISGDSGLNINLKENTIENVAHSACTYDSDLDYDSLLKELIKRWLFYSMIIESDKNSTNIAFIKSLKGLRISPDYDNSSMALLNNNIDSYISSIQYGTSVYDIIDQVKNNFCLRNDSNSNYYDDLRYLITRYPVIVSEIVPLIKQVDVRAAIETVERDNEIEIPWNVQYWTEKVIKTRITDMLSIYDATVDLDALLPSLLPTESEEDSDMKIYVFSKNKETSEN